MMQAEQDGPGPATSDNSGDLAILLDSMRDELVEAVHEVNNPLAIIAGNAQFLSELTRELEIDAELKRSIADIEHASIELAQRLQRLTRLKEELVEVRNGSY